MGRHKGGRNRRWTNEERLRFVLMCEEEHIPVCTVAREQGIPRGTLEGWIRRFREGGIEKLNPAQLHRGNPFAMLSNNKKLSETERLRLMVEKLTIENERLKKGYIVKGVGADKEFVTLKELNSK